MIVGCALGIALINFLQARHRGLVTRLGVLDALRDQRHPLDDLDEAVAHARSHVSRAGTG